MALHQAVQKVLLLGADLTTKPAPPAPEPPARLKPLIDSLAAAHRSHDAVAIAYGHRYRSGFWSIYLLSALAVFCAMMPLALGWDSRSSAWHPLAPAWVMSEIVVIAAVAFIYWRGHKGGWQGQWLRARTSAELVTYLPLIAPLVDWSRADRASWYSRALTPAVAAPAEIEDLCRANETQAHAALADAWTDAAFTSAYSFWAAGVLEAQQAYHERVARWNHVLRHRIHAITTTLFALTAVAALAHLAVHSRALSLVTTVFPALAAALHGALAQSECYRLEVGSERVAAELARYIGEIRSAHDIAALQDAVRGAIALLLQEHQDWTMLVKPHHLPLG
jgi:hypothetical protein